MTVVPPHFQYAISFWRGEGVSESSDCGVAFSGEKLRGGQGKRSAWEPADTFWLAELERLLPTGKPMPHTYLSLRHNQGPPPWESPESVHPTRASTSPRSWGEGATTCNKSRSCGNPEKVQVLEKSDQTTRKTKTAMS